MITPDLPIICGLMPDPFLVGRRAAGSEPPDVRELGDGEDRGGIYGRRT
jgi:hypothetical protein